MSDDIDHILSPRERRETIEILSPRLFDKVVSAMYRELEDTRRENARLKRRVAELEGQW